MNATKLTAFAATAAVAVTALAPAVSMAKATGPGKYTVTEQAYVYKQPTKIVDGTVFKGNTIKVEKLSKSGKYAYGLVDRFITALVDAGYLTDRARGSLVRFSFWMLGGAGLALAEAPEADRPRLREEWRYLIRQTISGLRAG